jgi:hypothetical protein
MPFRRSIARAIRLGRGAPQPGLVLASSCRSSERVWVENAIRAAETEAIFRDVNETLAQQQTPAGGEMTVLCECSNDSCAAIIAIPEPEYERVRSEGARFLVRPGHVAAEIEIVVEQKPDFWVIEKIGAAGDIAEETDPRA